MVRIPDVHINLSDLNHSELVLLAQWCGLPASRAVSRELLVESLETFEPIGVSMPLDDKREEMSEWLNRWWDVVRMQVPKKVCPNCLLCKDLQVMDCYLRNESNIRPGRR